MPKGLLICFTCIPNFQRQGAARELFGAFRPAERLETLAFKPAFATAYPHNVRLRDAI
jgi:hypothetical protein